MRSQAQGLARWLFALMIGTSPAVRGGPEATALALLPGPEVAAPVTGVAAEASPPMAQPAAGFGDVRINEIMAANSRGLRDDDGDHADWIELYNAGMSAVDLRGWYLTDTALNLRKWQFPTDGSVPLRPGGYLIVFASGKDRATAGAPLHTNFRLDQDGEFLALVLPNGTDLVSGFVPAFPPQFTDVSYGLDSIDPTLCGFFSSPTPGMMNSGAVAGRGIGPAVQFSHRSGTFRDPFWLELTVENPAFAIRYFLVTNAASAAVVNVPTSTGTLYTGPILVPGTLQVRARAYPTTPEYFAGPAQTETYIQVDAGAAAFTSPLPVVLFHNFNGSTIPSAPGGPGGVGVFMVFDTNNPAGVTSLTNPPVLVSRAGAHLHGSSAEGFQKKNLSIELWTEVNYEDRHAELLGMPADSDWFLYAPNMFDRGYLHHPIAYGLGRALGHYASRTRFAELFLSVTNAALTTGPGGMISYPATAGGNYNGLYVIEEKIKVHPGRVEIARLDAADTNAATITGGYLMKIDRANDVDDVNYFSPEAWPSSASSLFPWITVNHLGWNSQPIIFQDPDGTTIGTRPLQRQWLPQWMRQFEAALVSPNWTNPITGYAAYIDVDQWIEDHMLNTIPFNVNAYRLSGYFYKDRDQEGRPGTGKLRQGPLWDFDRSQGTGSVDPRAFNPRQWKRQLVGDQGTDFFGNNDNWTGTRLGVRWWWQLFHDPDFWQRWIDKWQEYRESGIYQTAYVMALIDRFGNEARPAALRNATRWPLGDSVGTPTTGIVSVDGYTYAFTNATYQGEIDFQKQWWKDRLEFIETNFLSRPRLSLPGQQVPPGFALVVDNPPGTRPGTVTYYTLDGTDPRLPGGHISPSALAAIAPFSISITQNTRVFLRNRNPNHANPTNTSLTAVGGNPPLSTPWSGARIGTYYVTVPALRITEIMARPATAPGGMPPASDFEYVEVQNIGDAPLDVTGFRLRGGVEFDFPSLVLAPGQFALVISDETAFASRYHTGDVTLAGVFTNHLEREARLVLEGSRREPILDFTYRASWFSVTDGLGFSLQIVDATRPVETLVDGTNAATWSLPSSWRPSASEIGTPGTADPGAPMLLPVYVNEALTHVDWPSCDAIELYNPNPAAVDLTGWFLTDDLSWPKQYRIPSGEIPGLGYRVFYATNSFELGGPGNPAGFHLSSLGEDVYLLSGDANTNLTGYCHGFHFGAQVKNATFGRWLSSEGREHFVTQAAPTLGGTNAGPAVGPVVLSEIQNVLLNPPGCAPNCADEFIELQNISDAPAALYDPLRPTNTWLLQGAVTYRFPAETTLPAHGHLLVLGFDPTQQATRAAAFRERYGLPVETLLLGPWEGEWDDASGVIELVRPDRRDSESLPYPGYVSYILAERVEYSLTPPWSAAAMAGTGLSAQRIVANQFGNDPANWTAARPTPGQPFPGGTAPSITSQPDSLVVVEGEPATFRVSVSGDGPFSFLWRRNGQPMIESESAALRFPSTTLADDGIYQVLVLGAAGAVASRNFELTVRPLPVIVTPPQSALVTNAANVIFTVVATGTGLLEYQWRHNGEDIEGARASSYRVAAAEWDRTDGYYTVVVTDRNGSRESAAALLTVQRAPTITRDLETLPGTNVLEGREFSLTISAEGNWPLGFLFRRASTTYTVQTFSSNHASAVLTFARATPDLTGAWQVIVTNGTSPYVRSGFQYVTVMPGAPFFAVQPTPPTAGPAGTTLLVSEARGTEPIGYQWFWQAQPLADATGAGLAIAHHAAALGDYTVVASNAWGMATSAVVHLTRPLLSVRWANGQADLSLAGVPGWPYAIESTDGLGPGNEWGSRIAFTLTNAVRSWRDDSATNVLQRFYRATQ